ncbi:HCL091Wp [Eremothecium sinecaudum]|uniref:HCL091Wp n=1 Tax=Eremothecium sinecaudum TaxID=45286 RepID=A0A0X8HRF2_9SACH|nr:HCL091Wp [Eremothecium sinecaudum]AMD20060.1 HCL091Wp [Eremothecium sinecaudum]
MQHSLPNVPFKVKARYSWPGEQRKDLGFLESDIIEVTKVTGDWLYGHLLRNKKSGYFPFHYVELLQGTYGNFDPQLRQANVNAAKLPTIVALETQATDDMASLDTQRESKKAAIRDDGKQAIEGSGPQLSKHAEKYGVEHISKKHDPMPTICDISGPVNPSKDPKKINEAHNINKDSNNDRESRYRSGHLKTKHNPTRLKQNRYSDLPPLPPMPNLPDIKNMIKKGLPGPASGRESQVENVTNTRKPRKVAAGIETQNPSYYRKHAEFYDGYVPSRADVSSSVFDRSKFMDESLNNSEDSFAYMSDFSATSAGSLLRHRFARSFAASFHRSQDLTDLDVYDSLAIMNSISSCNSPKALNKETPVAVTAANTKTPNNYPKLPDMTNLHISSNEGFEWLQAQVHIKRAKSITAREKRDREIRTLSANSEIVLRPHDYINQEINTNEVYHGEKPGLVDIDIKSMDKEKVDKQTREFCKRNETIDLENFSKSGLISGYKTDIERLRAIFIYCTEFFKLVDDNGKTDFEQAPKNLDSIMQSKRCTPYELTWIFKLMADSLGIKSDIILGFLKTPNTDNMTFKFNHCWLRIVVNQEMRFVDVILGNITNPIHEYINNKKQLEAQDFYFLTEPLQLIYSHIPHYYEEQHIVPAVDKFIAHCLPLVFPSFFINDLQLYKFNLGLCDLHNSEVFECSLKVPSNVDLLASVVVEGKYAEKYENKELALVQYKHHKRTRIACIKAVLPPKTHSAILHIHSGVNGFGLGNLSLAPLSMIVPLSHDGNSQDYEYVVRVSSKGTNDVDLYINQPQNKYLFHNRSYTFEVDQNPRDSVCYNPADSFTSHERHILIQSPTGEIYKLQKTSPNEVFSLWTAEIHIQDVGTWLGIITTATEQAGSVFAKWTSI